MIRHITTGLCAAALATVILMSPIDGQAGCSDSPEPHVDWTNCDKHKKILSGRDLTGGTLQRTDFSHSDLSGIVLI